MSCSTTCRDAQLADRKALKSDEPEVEDSIHQTPEPPEQAELSELEMKLNASAPEFEPLLPVTSNPSNAKLTSGQPKQVIISQSKLQPTNSDYSDQFYKFYTSFPPKDADFKTVQKWLKSWFKLQHVFDSDVGVERYISRIKMNGEDLRTKNIVGPFLHVLNL